MGPDPIAYGRTRVEVARKLREKLLSKGVKQGESWERLRRAFEMVLFEQARAGWYAARMVGAAEVRRNHKGDPGEKAPFEIVPAEQQRKAVAFACEQIFDEKAFQFAPELLTHLAASRWDHWGSDGSGSPQYPVHERVLLAQRYALDALLSDGVFARLRDDLVKTASNEEALTISELFTTLEKAIFKEVETHVQGASTRAPAISTFRQNLQDLYIRRLTDLALAEQAANSRPANAAAKKIAAVHVKAIADRCTAFLSQSNVDEDTRAHLEALVKHTERLRTAEFVHVASGVSGLSCALSPLGAAPTTLAPLLLGLVLLVLVRTRK